MYTIILLAIAATCIISYCLIISNKIEDRDRDFIPDVVEDKVKEVKTKVKKRTAEINKEVVELKVVANKTVKEVKDVVSAVKGKKRPAKKTTPKNSNI